MPVPSPSLINVRLEVGADGGVTELMTGGRAAISETKTIKLTNWILTKLRFLSGFEFIARFLGVLKAFFTGFHRSQAYAVSNELPADKP